MDGLLYIWLPKESHIEVVKLLLAAGANPDAVTSRMKYPQDLTTNPEIIQLLKNHRRPTSQM